MTCPTQRSNPFPVLTSVAVVSDASISSSRLLSRSSDVHEAEKSRTRPRPRQKIRGKAEARQRQKFSRQGEAEAEAGNSRPRQGSTGTVSFCFSVFVCFFSQKVIKLLSRASASEGGAVVVKNFSC